MQLKYDRPVTVRALRKEIKYVLFILNDSFFARRAGIIQAICQLYGRLDNF